MDYLTKPVSRKELREYAVVFRKLFGIQQHGRVPVMDVLEKFHLVFPGSFFSIAEDTDLPATLPARCNVLGNGKFEIEIRQTTYDGAYRNIGAYRDHIIHEICHAFLYTLGYTPIMQRSFENGRIVNYRSSEWQAKALCGEVMIPFDDTVSLSASEIAREYGVSPAQAKFRTRLDKVTRNLL